MIQTAFETLELVMKRLSEVAEKEIEERLYQVGLAAIDKAKESIVKEVSDKYRVAVDARLVQLIDSAGFSIEYNIKPKKKV